MRCIAYFLTWTTYGTWLHGDERGSVDFRHNRRGSQFVRPSEVRRTGAEAKMAETPCLLSDRAREVVDASIREVARRREWQIHALNVRTNHVHVVVTAGSHRPEIVMGQFKSWSTRGLQGAGLLEGRERVWTKRGSTRWLDDRRSLDAATEYVLNGQ